MGGEIAITRLVFILDYFQEKLMAKFFKKSKKLIFGAILDHFFPNNDKNEFSSKKMLSVFKHSDYLIIVQKIRKN